MATREDVEQIASSAWMIGRCAEDFAQGLESLEKTVGSEHPWGGDAPGNAFGRLYTDVLLHASDSLGSHVSQLVTASERLAAWAAQSTQAQQAGSETVSRVGQKLER
jgi:hypothetical protein